MNDHASDQKSAASASSRNLPIRPILAGVLLLAAVLAAWFLYLSPQARLHRTVSDMIRSFQSENLDRLMTHVSPYYQDPGGNGRDSLATLCRAVFENFSAIRVQTKSEKRIISGRNAAVLLTGRVIFTRDKTPYKTDYNETPFTMKFELRDGRWLLTSIDDVSTPVGDIDTVMKEVREFF